MSQVNLIVNSKVDSRENFKKLIAPQAGLLMFDEEGQQVVDNQIISGIKIGDGNRPWEELPYLSLDPNTADVWRKLVSTAASNAQLVTLPTVNFAYLTVSADKLDDAQYETILKQVLEKDVGLDLSLEQFQTWSVSQKVYIEQNGLRIVPNNFYLRGSASDNNKTIDRLIINEPNSPNGSYTLMLKDSTAEENIKSVEKRITEEVSSQIDTLNEKLSAVSTSVESFQKTENIFGYDSSVTGSNYGMVAFPTGKAENKSDYFLAADGKWRQISMNATNITYNNQSLDEVLNNITQNPGAAVKTYSGSQYGTTYVASLRSMPSTQGATVDALYCNSGVRIDNVNSVLYGAAWNDIAEFRQATKKFAPGHCLTEDNGTLVFSSHSRDRMCYIVSDTYGFCFGPEAETNVPVAIVGRVLAYAADRNSLKVGDAVCSDGRGQIRKMKWWEKIFYPQSIVGYVSEIPSYQYWGEHRTLVNERVWVRVR